MPNHEPFSFAILGGGPNALYLLERACAHLGAGAGPRQGLDLHVFDRNGAFGSGCHYTGQPSTNHLNRVADQISFGADKSHKDSIQHLPPEAEQRTLYRWCQERYAETGDERFDIGPREWVDRALFGEASEAVFQTYVQRLRSLGATVTLHQSEVLDLEPEERGGYRIHARDAERSMAIRADFIALCTGHGANRIAPGSAEARYTEHADRVPAATYLNHVYPIEEIGPKLVPPGKVVAIRGLGLAALDVILRLTQGRGGYFVRRRSSAEEMDYVPSGFEPLRIMPFSESGVFVFVRAYNQKLNDDSLFHDGVFFTRATIDKLRNTFGHAEDVPHVGRVRQLDFDRHILPIMVLETALIHVGALLGPEAREQFILNARPALSAFMDGDVALGARPDLLAATPLAEVRRLAERVRGVVLHECPADDETAEAATRAFLRFRYGAERTIKVAGLPLHEAVRRLADEPSPYGHDLDPLAHLFDWSKLIDPLAGTERLSATERRSAGLAWLRRDVLDARQGNIDNPRKAAIDGVWRDLRDTLRYAVEFGGLTASSHSRFAGVHCRMINRIAVGTSLKVMEKVWALARHGILDLSMARNPQLALDPEGYRLVDPHSDERADVAPILMNARVHKFDLREVSGSLFRRMTERGLIRAWRNPSKDGTSFEPGGLDITPSTALVVDAQGHANPRIAVLGPHTEGALYFHIAAARPYCNDPVVLDAEYVMNHALGFANSTVDLRTVA